jgi:hypothetical protein
MGNGRRVVKLNEASLRRLVRRMLRENDAQNAVTPESLARRATMSFGNDPYVGGGSEDEFISHAETYLAKNANLGSDAEKIAKGFLSYLYDQGYRVDTRH